MADVIGELEIDTVSFCLFCVFMADVIGELEIDTASFFRIEFTV